MSDDLLFSLFFFVINPEKSGMSQKSGIALTIWSKIVGNLLEKSDTTMENPE